MTRFTHKERRERRRKIADEFQQMSASVEKRSSIYSFLAQKYQVTMALIDQSCREFKTANSSEIPPTADVTEESIAEPAVEKIHPNTQRILDLLQNSEMTYREIAAEVGCTKQNVQGVHKRFLAEGYELPTRNEILERKMIAKQQDVLQKDQEFIRLYTETNDFEQSALAAGISLLRARKVRKANNLNGTGLLINKKLTEAYPQQKITGRWLHIVADILNTPLSGTKLAEKWQKPVPFIFNLIAECKAAGLQVPERVDGRESPRRTTPAKENVCKKCGNKFRVNFKLEDGTRIRGDHNRVHCFDCNPFVPKNASQDSEENKAFDDSDLQLCDENSDLEV
jgi:hypothetical protein